MKKSNHTGFQSSGKIELPTTETNSEILTDGGFPRREFPSVLDSLALLAGVPGSEATEYFELEIDRAHGSISADCGSVTTPGPVAEMFAIPDESEIRIKGYRAVDTDEHSVQLDIYTGSSEPRLSLKPGTLTRGSSPDRLTTRCSSGCRRWRHARMEMRGR